jgi:hypothetical protein
VIGDALATDAMAFTACGRAGTLLFVFFMIGTIHASSPSKKFPVFPKKSNHGLFVNASQVPCLEGTLFSKPIKKLRPVFKAEFPVALTLTQ